MELNKVLFIGSMRRPSSTQIRCVDIATRLGCDYQLGGLTMDNIPDRYAAFVCVKPALGKGVLDALAKKGKVIWDIIDILPPKKNVAVYLASTAFAMKRFAHLGRIVVIPHHHCNFEGTPNSESLRRPVWLGCRHWLPPLENIECDIHSDYGMTQESIVQVFRQTGISLNLRFLRADSHLKKSRLLSKLPAAVIDRVAEELFDFHVAVNSGIKLINSIGFGIPSISSDEPAYHEIGADCTIFSTLQDCGKWVKTLQSDDALYKRLRDNCVRKAAEFHLDAITRKYEALLSSL